MKHSYNPEIQYAAPAEIERYQAGRLAETVGYVAANSPFYRRMFDENDIDPQSIRSLEDLVRLPGPKRICNFTAVASCVCRQKRS